MEFSIYLDDILVAGRTLDEHLNRLSEVLKRLENSGMQLNKQKCKGFSFVFALVPGARS